LVAAVLLAASALAFAEHVRPDPPASTAVVVAARDLESGALIHRDDVRLVSMPDDVVPSAAATAVADVAGETVAAPMRAGEPLTDRRVVGASLVSGYPAGSVAAPIRVTDAEAAALLTVGDRVDVYSAPAVGDEARLVVADAPVVAVPRNGPDPGGGALIVLAVDDGAAASLAGTASHGVLSIVLR
jgi:Flp pilus assembly protein CpaB